MHIHEKSLILEIRIRSVEPRTVDTALVFVNGHDIDNIATISYIIYGHDTDDLANYCGPRELFS